MDGNLDYYVTWFLRLGNSGMVYDTTNAAPDCKVAGINRDIRWLLGVA